MPSQNGTQIHVEPARVGTGHRVRHGRVRLSNGAWSSSATAMKPTNEPTPAIATQRQRRVSRRPFGNTKATAIGHA